MKGRNRDYFWNRGDPHFIVVVQHEEGNQRLKRAICTAPALVVRALLFVVIVKVVALHTHHTLALRHALVQTLDHSALTASHPHLRCLAGDAIPCRRVRFYASPTKSTHTSKQVVRDAENGTILGNPEAVEILPPPRLVLRVFLPKLAECTQLGVFPLYGFFLGCVE